MFLAELQLLLMSEFLRFCVHRLNAPNLTRCRAAHRSANVFHSSKIFLSGVNFSKVL